MRRINVVGTSCSGKTTLARHLATLLGLPHVELDALFWGPGWRPVASDIFRDRVRAAVAEPAWVIDGGYSMLRDLTWPAADTVVWLDYPMPVVLGRWARRTFARIRSGEEFWPGTGNRETLRHSFGRGSLLAWIVSTHRARRRRTLEAARAHPRLRLVRLRSPAAADRFLRDVARDVGC